MALLVALSALAEQAAGRSFLVRYFVLWILRRAEAVVARFVLEATGAPAPAIVGTSAAGNGRADALLLAARLKALATAVGAILRWALILQPRSGEGPAPDLIQGGEGKARDGRGRRRPRGRSRDAPLPV